MESNARSDNTSTTARRPEDDTTSTTAGRPEDGRSGRGGATGVKRRAVLVGASVGAVGLAAPIVGASEHEDDGEDGTPDGGGAFEPEISVSDFQFSVRTDGDPPDTIRATTADGTVHQFGEDLTNWEDGGYIPANNDGPRFGPGWYGVIEEVEASRGDETVAQENEDPGDVDVTCTFMEGYEDAYDLTLSYEHASKRYDPPVGDEDTFGSPGRRLQSILEMADETEIVLDDPDCEPEGEPAVTFDCTSVTVEPEEFVNGPAEFYGPTLLFADGERQEVGDDDERFEPPVTLEGTDEHEGKVIERLNIWNDEFGTVMFSFDNPDVAACESMDQDDGAGDDEDGETDGDADGGDGDDGDAGGDEDDGEAGGDGDDEGTADEEGDADGEDGEEGDGDGEDGSGSDGSDSGGGSNDGDDGQSDDDGSSGDSDEDGDGEDDAQGDADKGGEAGAGDGDDVATQPEEEDGDATETSAGDGDDGSAGVDATDSTETPEGTVQMTPLGDVEEEGPGFGALAALGGLGGVGAYLARRVSDEPDQE